MASHLASLWKWDFLELGNGLFEICEIFGIRNAQGIRNPTNKWNPKSKFHWQRIKNLEPEIRNQRRGIQEPRLFWDIEDLRENLLTIYIFCYYLMSISYNI